MKSDIEISKEKALEDIKNIGRKLGIKEEDLELYGNFKAKINLSENDLKDKPSGKLVLVTAISPTPLGEGKTTMSIGINEGLRKLGKNSVVILREPSLGPVFGIKGGATGGGYSQVVPMEDINLHFTGDLHAITSCNNLLCAMIDNHLMQGNILNIDPSKITFKRVMDMNDRALREITIGLGKGNGIERNDSFQITVASEIMAILCLAKDLKDLKNRFNQILIGYTYDDKPIFVKDLGCSGAMTVLMKDAIKPNLVQTLEGNPAIIHGGPFANIAHGCNSVIATKLGLKLSDYVITEAGFGSDLGAFKFLDIKCRENNLKPDVIVVVATIKALKFNGNVLKENVNMPNLEALKIGIDNLKRHIENMKKLMDNVIVCLNQYHSDTKEEIDYIKDFCNSLGVTFTVSTSFKDGGEGAIDAAKKILEACEISKPLNMLYDKKDSLETKIENVCKEIFHAKEIIYSEKAKESIDLIISIGKLDLPICIAKTPLSFSDNPDLLGAPEDFTVTVKDVTLSLGAGFIVVLMGNIMVMPGLSKEPSALRIDIDENNEIIGLS